MPTVRPDTEEREVRNWLIGLEGGMNVYGYCGGNPVMGVDPDGHWVVPLAFRLMASRFSFQLMTSAEIGAGTVAAGAVGAATGGWLIGRAIDDHYGLSNEVLNYRSGAYALENEMSDTPARASHHNDVIRRWNGSSGTAKIALEAQYGWLATYAAFRNAGVSSGSIAIHHLLPQKLRGWFRGQGISNIDDDRFLLPLIVGHHQVVHGKGRPVNGWTGMEIGKSLCEQMGMRPQSRFSGSFSP